MKHVLYACSIFFLLSANAQVKTPQPSPSATIDQTIGLTNVEVVYSRPSAKGRMIFGDLVPFGKMWRTGANANTTISFSEDVMIDGKPLKKGKYAMYTTPKADMWEIYFYKTTDNWGTPDDWKDSDVALKAMAKPEMTNKFVESFTIGFSNLTSNDAVMDIMWEKTIVPVKIEVSTEKMAMESIEKTLAGPSSGDYYSAAQYYYQSNMDSAKALNYVNKALEVNKDKPFYMLRMKSLIQARTGDKKGAIETAKMSMTAAEAAKNADYVKMNKDSIAEWSKK